MYKAKEDIGDYKKGDIVPDDIAEVWAKMYVDSPVIFINNSEEKVEEIKPEEVEKPIVEDSKPDWIDDYLNRNGYVVIKNLGRDKFKVDVLEDLLKMEKSNKNRSNVINKIKREMKIGRFR